MSKPIGISLSPLLGIISIYLYDLAYIDKHYARIDNIICRVREGYIKWVMSINPSADRDTIIANNTWSAYIEEDMMEDLIRGILLDAIRTNDISNSAMVQIDKDDTMGMKIAEDIDHMVRDISEDLYLYIIMHDACTMCANFTNQDYACCTCVRNDTFKDNFMPTKAYMEFIKRYDTM